MSDEPSYEVVVIGGGPAGATTAIYTTRLGHRTAVFEAGGGRHASVDSVHNLFGVSEDVSGAELGKHAVDQFVEYGGDYFLDEVAAVRHADGDSERAGGFVVEASHATVTADRVVFATGFTDRGPSVPGLEAFAGRGLHYCLHCDAYTLGDGRVFVLGHDDHAASVAMLLLNFTADVDLLLDGHEPTWDESTERQLAAHPVDRIDRPVVGAFACDEDANEPWLGGLTFADADESFEGDGLLAGDAVLEDDALPDGDALLEGTEREYLGGFAMYGREYNADLATAIGCELTADGAIAVDETRATSVEGAYAVGDVTHGQNQTVVALGDGARAGLAIHKDLRRYPIPADELEETGIDESAVPAAPADLRARMRRLRTVDRHAGLRNPTPDH